MILIDTSAWIEFLRVNGNAEIESRVHRLLLRNEAAWCGIIQIELWNGTSGDGDTKRMKGLSTAVTDLEINAEVWSRSRDLARKARAKAFTFPAADLLIAACAFHHGVEIESCDRHFQMLDEFR